jgi:photosystem II Psb27 protein
MATQSMNALRTLSTAAALLAPFAAASAALAADSAAPVETPKVELGPAPTDFGLKLTDYYDDCQKVVNHIRYAVQLEKGNPVIADFAGKTKEEMNDFVAFYRRFSGIQGRQSFSLLYTSINVLAGHYTSYGLKFPVPEKRRKRLLQELVDIEKNIRKKR